MSVGAVHPRRRRHSKQHRIEELLRSLGNDWQGGPTALARIAAEQLCEIVTKQEARLVLMQSKLPPQEPLPPPPEVGQFRSWVADIWRHRDQLVYISAMKLDSNARLRRRISVELPQEDNGDELSGLTPQSQLDPLDATPDVVEVVGALSVIDQRDKQSSVGLLTCAASVESLTPGTVCGWIERDLVPLLGAYPGRCSLIICDDLPLIRGHAAKNRLSVAISACGGRFCVRPQQSHDFDPLERIWDQVAVVLHQNSTGPVLGRRGERLFCLRDVNAAFNAARLPHSVIDEVMNTVTTAQE